MDDHSKDNTTLIRKLCTTHSISQKHLALVIWRVMHKLLPDVVQLDSNVGLRIFSNFDLKTQRALVDDVVISYPISSSSSLPTTTLAEEYATYEFVHGAWLAAKGTECQ